MYAVLKSFGLKGLNGFPVEVEADISGGMPALSIVGLPDSAVRESGDRVHAALKNLGFKWPDRRITINTDRHVAYIALFTMDGRQLAMNFDTNVVDASTLRSGIYVAKAVLDDDTVHTATIAIK